MYVCTRLEPPDNAPVAPVYPHSRTVHDRTVTFTTAVTAIVPHTPSECSQGASDVIRKHLIPITVGPITSPLCSGGDVRNPQNSQDRGRLILHTSTLSPHARSCSSYRTHSRSELVFPGLTSYGANVHNCSRFSSFPRSPHASTPPAPTPRLTLQSRSSSCSFSILLEFEFPVRQLSHQKPSSRGWLTLLQLYDVCCKPLPSYLWHRLDTQGAQPAPAYMVELKLHKRSLFSTWGIIASTCSVLVLKPCPLI